MDTTERAHTRGKENGEGVGGSGGDGTSRRADRDVTAGLRLRVGAAGGSAGRGARREAGHATAAGASRRGRDDYFVELTLGQSIVLVLLLLLAHVAGAHPSRLPPDPLLVLVCAPPFCGNIPPRRCAGLLAVYWRGTSTIMQVMRRRTGQLRNITC